MGHLGHGTSGFFGFALGIAAAALLQGSASLVAADSKAKGGPLKQGELTPIEQFLGTNLKLDTQGGSGASTSAPPPILAGPRTGSGFVPGADTPTPTQPATRAAPGTPGYSSDQGTAYGTNNQARATVTKPSDKSVTPEPETQSGAQPSAAPAPSSTPTATNFVDPFGSGDPATAGGSSPGSSTGSPSTVSGTFATSGKGIFGSKGLFREPTLADIQAAESMSREELEAKGLAQGLDKYVSKNGGKLPEQFAHGSYFATVAGAGPMAPQEGASISVGGNVYEFHAGSYVKIAAPLKNLPERKPAGIVHLPSTIELHANLGPLPVDRYGQKNELTLGACKQSQTVRECVKQILADKARQKVKGLRFMFGLVGGGYSTAILPDGKLNPAWVKNLETFMKDVKDAGIKEIAPTPVFGGWAGDRVKEMEATDECVPVGHPKRHTRLKFYAAQPWGTRLEDSLPHGGGDPDAYNCSPHNPTFVGWKAIHGALETMLGAAKAAKLDVYELDLNHEINVDWFTVQARMIYDNKHAKSGDPDLLKVTRYLMIKNGFDASRVTYSVAETTPSQPGYDCASSYGDSARVAALSALLEAMAGAPFGHAKDWSVDKGLGCGGTSAGGVRLAVKHPLPRIVDVHSYTTGESSIIKVETTLWTNAVDSAMKKRGLASALFVLGETHSNTRGPSGKSCEGAAPDAGVDLARTLGDSKLAVRQAVIRPWYNQTSSCYPISQKLSPPLIQSR